MVECVICRSVGSKGAKRALPRSRSVDAIDAQAVQRGVARRLDGPYEARVDELGCARRCIARIVAVWAMQESFHRIVLENLEALICGSWDCQATTWRERMVLRISSSQRQFMQAPFMSLTPIRQSPVAARTRDMTSSATWFARMRPSRRTISTYPGSARSSFRRRRIGSKYSQRAAKSLFLKSP
jgi:hypothetical protein